jgi:AcrR family transcriptional regulator
VSPAPTAPTSTRDRILTESMRLFAARGFDATSITMIEAASGLSPGSGGVYKHFPSKRAILEAGIEAATESTVSARAEGAYPVDTPLRDALAQVIDFGLAELALQRDFIRVLFRELDPYPDLLQGLRDRYIQQSYRALAAWIRGGQRAGAIRSDADPLAAAAVLMGSFVNVRVLETFLAERPGHLSVRRFRAEWIELSVRALQP